MIGFNPTTTFKEFQQLLIIHSDTPEVKRLLQDDQGNETSVTKDVENHLTPTGS